MMSINKLLTIAPTPGISKQIPDKKTRKPTQREETGIKKERDVKQQRPRKEKNEERQKREVIDR